MDIYEKVNVGKNNEFHNEKNIPQNDRSNTMYFNYKIVTISKIAVYFLFWHCIFLKLHSSQTIRIEKLFHVYY